MSSSNLSSQQALSKEWERTYQKLTWLVANPAKFTKILRRWNISKDARILDLCCGTGGCFEVFCREGYADLYGIDISVNLLASVTSRVMLIRGNVFCCPIKDNAFDVVFINKALHHFLDHASILAEIKRILKPQGHFCFVEPRTTWFRNLYHAICLSPIVNIVPSLRSLRSAVLAEGDTYFPWLENAESFMHMLENDFGFSIESNCRDLRDYVVKCRNNKA